MKKIIISILTFLILFSSTFADEKQKTLSNPKIKKIQPWKDKNLSLPEQVELYKKSLKENKTILKNKKFEVDLTEEVNEEELWNSWPVGATVYDATYGYCFGLTLQGSQLNQAFLNGDFLYAYLFTLGSNYPCNVLECINLHGWGEGQRVKDVEQGSFSPDKRWFIYEHYLGRDTFLPDDLGLVWLGDVSFCRWNLTGCEHKSLEHEFAGTDDPQAQKFPWPKGDRSRTWNLMSNFLWDKEGKNTFFVVGEKGQPDKSEELQFTGVYLIKLSTPDLKPEEYVLRNIKLTFNSKRIKGLGKYEKLSWDDKGNLVISGEHQTESVAINDFDSTWNVPNEKPCLTEDE